MKNEKKVQDSRTEAKNDGDAKNCVKNTKTKHEKFYFINVKSKMCVKKKQIQWKIMQK